MTFWWGSESGSADPCLWLIYLRSGSCYFRHWPSRCQQKTSLEKKIFCVLLFGGTFTSFFKDKKSKRVSKQVGILTIFAWRYKDPDPDPWVPKTYGYGSDGSASATLIPADDVCQEVRMTARQQRLDEAARLCGRILDTPQLRPASVKALATIILDIALTDLQAEEGREIALGML